ncbi:Crp/Fnr family transcriptional regulator [Thalassococcus sp. CAU 1522]|uniref:Crp/Fnr family transcriptional regulator n=1 Tax=Thalassococcus arenae TaxID=2851652 RepID=A0ABS6NA16_9RHOB|nr:Crp/Fnr family transcriptional regulator [Thalassococcus arenae]MBV2360863.1 Crp/Fnr family transcriptional regulator [Thalassococcus arenae]
MIGPPFDSLPEAALRRVALAQGDRLFAEADRADAIFAIETGSVHLVRVTVEGQRVVIARAGPGATLAEAALFADRYHCDAVAIEPAMAWRIDKSAVLAALRAGGDFAETLCAHLAGQVRQERLRREIIAIRSAEDRVLAALVGLGQPGTVTAFAAEIGLTQEACARALTRLVAAGRVSKVARGRYAAR